MVWQEQGVESNKNVLSDSLSGGCAMGYECFLLSGFLDKVVLCGRVL